MQTKEIISVHGA